MDYEQYRHTLSNTSEEELEDFCIKHHLHGTPYLFVDRESEYYEFKKRLVKKFNVAHHEIYITGSAKSGFSFRKGTYFSEDSDVDIAIVSKRLYEEIMLSIYEYQMALREGRKSVGEREIENYHRFLEYSALGWMRPDLLPESFRIKAMKTDWFDFFSSISYGRSEIGNYKASAGVFKDYFYLEKYTLCGVKDFWRRTRLEAI